LATHTTLRGMALKPMKILAVLLVAVTVPGTILVGSVSWSGPPAAPPMTNAAPEVEPAPKEPVTEPEYVEPRQLALLEWPVYRGNASRTGQGAGGDFKLLPAWQLSTVSPPESGSRDARDWAEDMINKGTRELEQKGRPVLHAFQPLAVD